MISIASRAEIERKPASLLPRDNGEPTSRRTACAAIRRSSDLAGL